MRWLPFRLSAFALLAALAVIPAQAQQRTVVYVEEWVEVGQSATRFVVPPAEQAEQQAIAGAFSRFIPAI